MESHKKQIKQALGNFKAPPTEIEVAIVKGAIFANDHHDKMVGYWLSSAPESFLNTHIGLAIAQTDHQAYVDTSFKRMSQDLDWISVGRPPKSLTQRPDITVIKKTEGKIKTLIETKISYSSTGPKNDIKKLQNYLKEKNSPQFGYLLVFTYGKSKKGKDRLIELLETKLKSWSSDKAKLRMLYACPDFDVDGEQTYGWAIALYKVPRPSQK